MSRIQVNPEELAPRAISDGVHPAIIEKCEHQAQKADPSKMKVYWQFRIDGDDDPVNNGQALFSHTSTEPGKGGQYLKFVRGLGFNPSDFETEEAQGMPCLLRTKQSIRKNNMTGDSEVTADVVEVTKR